MRVVSCAPPAARADEGNRTPITSLEGWGSTVELHPHQPARPEVRGRALHLLGERARPWLLYVVAKVSASAIGAYQHDI
jgi:hypothetical protein